MMGVSDVEGKDKAALYASARDAAVAAAKEAARIIGPRAGRVGGGDVWAKGHNELVTRIDEASQEAIVASLHEAFPSFDVLAEEGADLDAERTAAPGFRWIIDPIDGTTNFTHGVPPYAVSIGLQHGEEVVVGVVLDVSRGELFTAVRGGGLTVDGVPSAVSRTEALAESLVTTGFPYRSFAHVDAYMEVLAAFVRSTRGVRRPGSAAVDLAYVACGRFDAFFETGLSPWDVAAGTLLVEEGGGRVTDFRNAKDVLFGRQILATNGILHQAMLDDLEPLLDVRA